MARSAALGSSILALFFALPLAASADVIHLKDGRTVSGESERTPGGIRVKQGLGTVLIPHDQVARVEKRETPRQVYERRKKGLVPGDVEGALALAEFCVTEGLLGQGRSLALEVLALGKKAGQARLHGVLTSLDFHLVKGQWQAPEVYYPAQGFERIDGRWLPPERARVVRASRLLRALRKSIKAVAKSVDYEAGGVKAAERRLQRAEERLEEELAAQVRLVGEVAAARVELRRREQDLDHAQARSLQARQVYDAWITRPCTCHDACACGFEGRRLRLERDCSAREDGLRKAREVRDEASADLQCLLERQAQGPNRVARLERALADAEAGLPRARARFAAARVDHEKALADLAAAERELRVAKAARDALN
jgi:hypothetical protein